MQSYAGPTVHFDASCCFFCLQATSFGVDDGLDYTNSLEVLSERCAWLEDRVAGASVPIRRAMSKYGAERVGVTVDFYCGELSGVGYSDPDTFPHQAHSHQ